MESWATGRVKRECRVVFSYRNALSFCPVEVVLHGARPGVEPATPVSPYSAPGCSSFGCGVACLIPSQSAFFCSPATPPKGIRLIKRWHHLGSMARCHRDFGESLRLPLCPECEMPGLSHISSNIVTCRET